MCPLKSYASWWASCSCCLASNGSRMPFNATPGSSSSMMNRPPTKRTWPRRARAGNQRSPASIRSGWCSPSVGALGRAGSGLHRHFLWRQRSGRHWQRGPGCSSGRRAGDRRRRPGAGSPPTHPGEQLEVCGRHHAHHLWHVLGRREFWHQLALLRPVSAHPGGPLPGRIGTADHSDQAASVARGIGNGDIAGNHALSREGGSTMNIILIVILALIHFLGALAALRGGSGIILIVGVLATLVATLGREVIRPENKQKA